MSILFCHDHRFILGADGAVYSSGQYDRSFVALYEAAFGRLTIAGRAREQRPDEDAAKLSPVFPSRDQFFAAPDVSSLKGLLFDPDGLKDRMAELVSQADLVIARLPSEIGMIAIDAARKQGVPVAVEVVACVWDGLHSHGSPKAKLYAPVAKWRMQRAVKQAQFAHYVTQSFLQQRYPASGHAVGFSDVEIVEPEAATLERRLAGIDAGEPECTFGMVAALFHKEKGVDVTIRALAQARKQDPSLKLKVAGPGDIAPWMEYAQQQGVADAVTFAGVLQRGQGVRDFIDTIDVYVQASYQEGLPRALIEAMSRATPALASSAGGTYELVGDAWRHQPGDDARLAQQMLAVRAAQVRHEMAEANFRRAADFAPSISLARRSAYWNHIKSEIGMQMPQPEGVAV